jgi:hypothetical protein
MADKKAYAPTCSADALLAANEAIFNAQTADDMSAAIATHGPKVGYKAFCYMASGKTSAFDLIQAKHDAGHDNAVPGDSNIVPAPRKIAEVEKPAETVEDVAAKKARLIAMAATLRK